MREIENLLRAKIECIWVQTYEEATFIDDMKELLGSTARFNKLQLMQWSLTEGVTKLNFVDANLVKTNPPDKKYAEFPALFSLIKNESISSDGKDNVWLLRDMDAIIKETKCWRSIRDMKEYRSSHYNPIIIISSTMNIPDQVSRLFTVIEYDLPDKEEIYEMVNASNIQVERFAQTKNDESYVVLKDDEKEAVVNALNGLTRKEIEIALRKSMVSYHYLNCEYLSKSKIDAVKKTGVLDYRVPTIGMDDIGGNSIIKEWLHEAISAFDDQAAEFGLDKPKGYMAVGIPGSGKTALAEAFAKEMKVPLLELSMNRVMDKLVGQSEQKIAQALAVAKACAPCVLLLDEVEKMLGAGAMSSNASDGGVTARILQAILKFMNDNDSGVYVIMTSNDVSQLPPEFTRAGRLDATWYFGLPDEEERRGIFRIHFSKKGREVSDIILNEAVRSSEGFTGAEIQQVVKNTMRKAFSRYLKDGNKNILVEDVKGAADEVIPVSMSSKEKIAALDTYCRSRARSTSLRHVVDKREIADNDFELDL